MLDRQDDTPIIGATVYIQELKVGVVTDTNGSFILDKLCVGDYHVQSSHVSYTSTSLFHSLSENSDIVIYMEPRPEVLQAVEIKSSTSESIKGMTKSVISNETLLELGGRSLGDIISVLPGVHTLKSGSGVSKPIINGLYGNRITILNHGIPQEGQQWGNDHAPEIDPNTADKISIYKGGVAIKYGLQALGGLVVLEPYDLKYDPHIHGSIRLQGQSNGKKLGINSSITKSSSLGNMKFTAGASVAGDKSTPSYLLNNTGQQEFSFSGLIQNKNFEKHSRKLYYSLYSTKLGILRGSHLGNTTDLQEAILRKVPFFTSDTFSYSINAPKQEVVHHLFKYQHKYIMNDQTVLLATGAFQVNHRKEFDIRRSDKNKNPSLDLVLLSQYYDIMLMQEHSNKFTQYFGLQYRFGDNTNTPGTGVRPLIPNYLSQNIATYYFGEKKWNSLNLEWSGRLEYRYYDVYLSKPASGKDENPTKNFLNFATNVGLKKMIRNDFFTLLSISYTKRPPEINELFSTGLHQGISAIEEGNDAIGSEHSLKVINEWSGFVSKTHQINFTAFYHYFDNYIYLKPTDELRLTIRGAFPVFRYETAKVHLAGTNIKYNFQISNNWVWETKCNYIYAYNRTQKSGLIWTPPLDVSSQIYFQMEKSTWFHHLKIGVEHNFVSKQTQVAASEDILPSPKAYALTALLCKLQWRKRSGYNVDLIVRADNLFDVEYRDYMNRFRYFADEVGRNISVSLQTFF